MGVISDYLTSETRFLTTEEIDDAKRVFQRTIRYQLVAIADDLGAGGRPWTEPTGGPMNLYVIHLGPLGFASTTDSGMRATLIHELCHVWQGTQHVLAWSYVVGSLANQALMGNAAYDYQPGDLWGEYNFEQQAQIVEDWYAGGLRSDSPLYRYIVGNIRCPVRSWFGEILTEIGAGAAAVSR